MKSIESPRNSFLFLAHNSIRRLERSIENPKFFVATMRLRGEVSACAHAWERGTRSAG